MENDSDDFKIWDKDDVFWWNFSTRLNYMLYGSRHEPLCSRVYRQRPSIYRTAYIQAMDILFREKNHCLRVYKIWASR